MVVSGGNDGSSSSTGESILRWRWQWDVGSGTDTGGIGSSVVVVDVVVRRASHLQWMNDCANCAI